MDPPTRSLETRQKEAIGFSYGSKNDEIFVSVNLKLQVGSNKYFAERKFSKEGNASITSSKLLRNIPRFKTSRV